MNRLKRVSWQKWVYAGAAVFLLMFAVVFLSRGYNGFAAIMAVGVLASIVLLVTEP